MAEGRAASVTQWTIIYDDFSEFSYLDGPPDAAPPFGVVAIPQTDPDRGRNIMHGWDHYYWNDSEGRAPMWWGADTFGVFDRLHHRKCMRAVLLGRTVSNDVWEAIMRRADEFYRGFLP